MVEAALVFPLVILAVVAIVHMLVFFYQITEVGANMHMALRAESGRVSNTVECQPHKKAEFPIYKRKQQVYYLGNMTFMGQGILNRLEKPLSARKYVDHEADFVRNVEFSKKKERADEQDE